MAVFPKFDRSLIPGVSKTLATLAALAGGNGNSQKPSIVKKSTENPWGQDDWQQFYDERAAVLEYDHELPKSDAEARAWEWCIVEWLDQHPAPSKPDRCAWCDKPAEAGVIVPFGIEATWLHHDCWEPWHQVRRQEAASAMVDMGISPLVPGDVITS